MNGGALLQAYYQAYNAVDEAKLRQLMADDVTLHPIGEAEPIVGIEAYLEVFRLMHSHFYDVMEPQNITADGERVQVKVVNRLTAKADVDGLFGMTLAQGETLTLVLDAAYTVRADQIVQIEIRPSL